MWHKIGIKRVLMIVLLLLIAVTTAVSMVDTPQKIYDIPSPKDRIKEDQIRVYDDGVVITIPNAEWATFTDSNSMDPFIDEGANAIEIVPKHQSEIQIGDVISYKSKLVDATIIHRVVNISEDEEGWYATTKGDNLTQEDPEKIRFDMVQRIVVAVIY